MLLPIRAYVYVMHFSNTCTILYDTEDVEICAEIFSKPSGMIMAQIS